MTVEKTDISTFLSLAKTAPVLDVRSPGEYNHAHLPGAFCFPLFTDEERKVVGTTYKQKSRELAIKIGLDYFGPKMRKMVEEVEGIIGNRQFAKGNAENHAISDYKLSLDNCILLYCWRGGMRSAAVAWLLDLYGYKVYTLAGGYKTFRNHALSTFKIPFPINIIGGYTGSGKTEVLLELANRGEKVVDLEAIAIHKGSAFGNIGLPQQPTQEMFENLLALKLIEVNEKLKADADLVLWVEDESQRIGMVNIPGDFWKNMRSSSIFFLDIPFELRLEHIVQEYGRLDQEKVINAIERIQKRLGNQEAKTAIAHLCENKVSDCFRILLKYYDKYYLKGLYNREGLNSLLHEIACEEIGPQNAGLLFQKA